MDVPSSSWMVLHSFYCLILKCNSLGKNPIDITGKGEARLHEWALVRSQRTTHHLDVVDFDPSCNLFEVSNLGKRTTPRFLQSQGASLRWISVVQKDTQPRPFEVDQSTNVFVDVGGV